MMKTLFSVIHLVRPFSRQGQNDMYNYLPHGQNVCVLFLIVLLRRETHRCLCKAHCVKWRERHQSDVLSQ